MAERHAWLVLTKQIAVGIVSLVALAQIAGQIMIHKPGTIRVERVYPVGLAKSIVDCGIERGGGHQRA